MGKLGDIYDIERELAGGGMARVLVARDRALDRRIVIKTLAGDFAASVDADRFRREIRLAASLQQANIVPVLAAGDVDGMPYLHDAVRGRGESSRSTGSLWRASGA